jgi:beta-glucosidase
MTLEEKAAQMVGVWNGKAETLVDAAGRFDLEKAKAAYADRLGLGQVGRPSDAGGGLDARRTAELTNAIQRFFLENTRLCIPVVFHEECLHGHAAIDATSFPQPIGLASTFNTALVESLYTMTALEARVRGAHQALTPVVDVARDPRWGRVEETFGEDPHLVSRMGMAAVRGFQGDATFRDGTRVIATLKHFAAHGQPESGINCAPAELSPRTLRDVILPPFRDAVTRAGAVSVMPSYNEIDGVPSHANRWLLRDVLRGEWAFTGYTVSDYYAIWELGYRPDTHGHFVAHDKKEACKLAVEAGVNIELPEPDCYRHLVELVREGTLREAQLDELVAPMLRWKFQMGLFDRPYVDPDEAERVVGCEAHGRLALQAARETIVLLKNEGRLLPLDAAKLRSIAVIGPNAHRPMLGGYSGVPKRVVTALDGIRAAVGDRVEVRYHEGCKITIGGSWTEDRVVPSDPDEDRRQIAEAVKLAAGADAIVLVIGGNEQTSREGWSLQHLGDRASLDLVGRQEELAEALLATGKPVVVCLFNGRPISIRALAQHAPAILECWYLGQEGGTALAEVLFGTVNPSGKLPITVPRSAGHLPAFYNHKPSARRGYLFDDVSPLWAFGYGLSYTTFAVANVRLAHPSIRRDGTATVLADVTNTGRREGMEVVQLYVRDRVSSVTRPVKELKGFTKVSLKPRETRTVAFDITPDALAFHDVAMRYVVEPGEFTILVGTSSRDEDLKSVTLVVEG